MCAASVAKSLEPPPSISALIPPWPPRPGARAEARVLDVLRSGLWGSTQGGVVEALNARLAALHGAPAAVCCANGTIALVLALKAAGLRPGDEVIVPSYTFIATASAAMLIGAVPVFAEVDPDTMLLDPADVAARLGPRTRAVIPVHLAGAVAEAAQLRRALSGAGVSVIEDAAQAVGARHVEGPVGLLGDMATLSFQTSKNVSAGEGGAVIVREAAMGERLWSLHNAGRTRGGAWYQHDHVGWNLRMTEVQGVLVDSMLDAFEAMQAARAQGWARLADLVAREGLPLKPIESPRTRVHARHLMMWRLDTARRGRALRDGLVAKLQEIGVHASPGYPGLHRIEAIGRGVVDLGGAPPAALPRTEAAADATFWLPQPVLMAGEEAHRAIVAAMARALG